MAISNGKETICETGYIYGVVADDVRGENGFGFDEIFELEDGRTLAELTNEEKNKISARKVALEKLRERLLKREIEWFFIKKKEIKLKKSLSFFISLW